MKNVQMRINPKLYAKFKLVSGESNNERMSKLLDDSQLNFKLIRDVNYHKETAKQWSSACISRSAANKTLASALVVSIAVSVCSVAYVCVVNGWFA
ncbi:TMhelix containing protein [Vibrio phage 1.144.O._10N.286.45.B3]|nr:TMhelix containing protein [Vibrio phage 1.144.O._10N.286.45.B3]